MKNNISLNNGKYNIILNETGLPVECLRHGYPWRRLVGDNLILSLVTALQDAQGTQQPSILADGEVCMAADKIKIKPVPLEELAARVWALEEGNTIEFYGDYDEEFDLTSAAYSVTKIKWADAPIAVSNYYGGGGLFCMETAYPNTSDSFILSFVEYLQNNDFSAHAYVEEIQDCTQRIT